MTNETYYQRNKHKWIRDTEDKKERHRQLVRESAARHRGKRDKKSREWNSKNYNRVLFGQARRSSKVRGLAFNLSLEDIIIPELCPYLEIPLTAIQGQGIVWSNASIDRIDNSKGYIKGNIMICSRLANSMKQHATIEEVLRFSKNAINIFKDYVNS